MTVLAQLKSELFGSTFLCDDGCARSSCSCSALALLNFFTHCMHVSFGVVVPMAAGCSAVDASVVDIFTVLGAIFAGLCQTFLSMSRSQNCESMMSIRKSKIILLCDVMQVCD